MEQMYEAKLGSQVEYISLPLLPFLTDNPADDNFVSEDPKALLLPLQNGITGHLRSVITKDWRNYLFKVSSEIPQRGQEGITRRPPPPPASPQAIKVQLIKTKILLRFVWASNFTPIGQRRGRGEEIVSFGKFHQGI
ncbi:hypothetical protein CDAR_74201 [Caerostris darwini]|uniref:Uncharacterized protein n=1 Tax=Caerostris darwini TaxID=1538125 RepID=A0AAV4Q8K3_9ARAC|nr:hypothetical protein CDAR_74201 [Caerostris darwini]